MKIKYYNKKKDTPVFPITQEITRILESSVSGIGDKDQMYIFYYATQLHITPFGQLYYRVKTIKTWK
jgi:hypothetical protein